MLIMKLLQWSVFVISDFFLARQMRVFSLKKYRIVKVILDIQ